MGVSLIDASKKRHKRLFFGALVLGLLVIVLSMQNCGVAPRGLVVPPSYKGEGSTTSTTVVSTTTTQPTSTTFGTTTTSRTTTSSTTTTTMALPAARGRPIFRNGTLYTDTGTMLRGTYVSFDILNGVAPTQAQLQGIKAMGLNAVHLYAESPGNQMAGCGYAAGSKLNQVRAFNNMLRNEGLYLIITIGGGCRLGNIPLQGESIYLQYALDFWNAYAAEFGNDTNVVFELYNEPYFYFNPDGVLIAQPSTANTRDLMARTYVAARTRAPQTPILLFSYATLRDADGVTADIQAVRTQVQGLGKTLTNWGIGFHPYLIEHTNLATAIRTLLDRGESLVMTELETVIDNGQGYCTIPGQPPSSLCVNRDLVQLFETLEISWLNFLSVSTISSANFKAQIEYGINGGSIIWVPDFGVWPALSLPPSAGSVVSLRSRANSLWVSAARVGGTPGTTPLTADRATASTTGEEFEIVRSGKRVCLKSRANNRIVDPAWTSSSPFLIASKTSCMPEYAFEWLIVPDGNILLRAPRQVNSAISRPSWGIVSTDLNLNKELIANRLLMGLWEKFEVVSH